MSYSNEDCAHWGSGDPHQPALSFFFGALAVQMRKMADTLERDGEIRHINSELFDLQTNMAWVNWKVCKRINPELRGDEFRL